ncbi:MAG: polysaccharide deacetylase family protein, partial [Casimicrobiaceae bacterium]
CYHRFGARGSRLNVTPAAFEAQMEFLARNGYQVVPISKLAGFLDGREALPPKTVAITIDDGYRSTFDIAWPILRKFGFPATVYLYTDFVGAGDALTWAQMKEMTASGLIDIQPHSKTHANLTLRLPGEQEARYRDRVRREVEAPVATLRDRLGMTSVSYAYPYGDVNDYVIELLTKQKIDHGVTVTPGGNAFFAYPMMLRRSMIFGSEDLDAFKAKLTTFVRIGAR